MSCPAGTREIAAAASIAPGRPQAPARPKGTLRPWARTLPSSLVPSSGRLSPSFVIVAAMLRPWLNALTAGSASVLAALVPAAAAVRTNARRVRLNTIFSVRGAPAVHPVGHVLPLASWHSATLRRLMISAWALRSPFFGRTFVLRGPVAAAVASRTRTGGLAATLVIYQRTTSPRACVPGTLLRRLTLSVCPAFLVSPGCSSLLVPCLGPQLLNIAIGEVRTSLRV